MSDLCQVFFTFFAFTRAPSLTDCLEGADLSKQVLGSQLKSDEINKQTDNNKNNLNVI